MNTPWSAVNVDVDNLWILKEEFGISGALDEDVIFDKALPAALEAFRAVKIKATFFMVGQDLQRSSCRAFALQACKEGHFIANHSWSHSPHFWKLPIDKKRDEVVRCHDLIADITGVAPTGFRSPGYYLDEELITVLEELNYSYDSSVLPGPYVLALAGFMFLQSKGRLRKRFGRLTYLWASRESKLIGEAKTLVEIPIYTTRLFHLPSHASISFMLGHNYHEFVKDQFRKETGGVIYLFHATDWLDEKSAPALGKIVPAMKIPLSSRIPLMIDTLNALPTPRIPLEEAASLIRSELRESIAR